MRRNNNFESMPNPDVENENEKDKEDIESIEIIKEKKYGQQEMFALDMAIDEKEKVDGFITKTGKSKFVRNAVKVLGGAMLIGTLTFVNMERNQKALIKEDGVKMENLYKMEKEKQEEQDEFLQMLEGLHGRNQEIRHEMSFGQAKTVSRLCRIIDDLMDWTPDVYRRDKIQTVEKAFEKGMAMITSDLERGGIDGLTAAVKGAGDLSNLARRLSSRLNLITANTLNEVNPEEKMREIDKLQNDAKEKLNKIYLSIGAKAAIENVVETVM